MPTSTMDIINDNKKTLRYLRRMEYEWSGIEI